jgi:hypothetical protein
VPPPSSQEEKKAKEDDMPDAKQFASEIMNRFTGSEHWYRHWANRKILYTDGAHHVAEHGGALWLLDLIAIEQTYNKTVAAEEFQVWTLKVDLVRHTGQLTCEDGNGNVVFTKAIEFTDFPVAEITLWLENNTIYLPSER